MASRICHAIAVTKQVRLELSVCKVRTDDDVIAVNVSYCELYSSRVRIHLWLFLKLCHQGPSSSQCRVKIIYQEEQEQAVARLSMSTTGQCRVLVGSPRVKAKENSPVCVLNLPEVVVVRFRLVEAKQCLIPLEAHRHIVNADDCPKSLHGLVCSLTLELCGGCRGKTASAQSVHGRPLD